ncbi:MAG: DinB family protein [Gemmatimonadales bacterium]
MSETARLVDQLERGFRGDAWHGTALRTLLNGIDAASATRRPLPDAHTIWELTGHITFWLNVVRRRLGGEVVVGRDGDDWIRVDAGTPAQWRDTLVALDAEHDRLVTAVRALASGDLERSVPAMPYTNYVMLHGVLQHNLYHAGQIAMLVRSAGGRVPA